VAALARLLLLLVAAAFAWNLSRGTHWKWLRAKFLGQSGTAAKKTSGGAGNAPSSAPGGSGGDGSGAGGGVGVYD
jgi:hypothetical protein